MKANLFAGASPPVDGERFETLLAHRNLVIERIVSSGNATPIEYLQTQDEWVLLVRGDARLDVAGEDVVLEAGDYVFLPAGTRHSVVHASNGALWVAVHLHPDSTRT